MPNAAPDSSLTRHGSVRNEVDKRKDQNPHDVDEVPVQAGNLDPQGMFLVESPSERLSYKRPEPEHADEDVGAVKARQGEEGRVRQVNLAEFAGPTRNATPAGGVARFPPLAPVLRGEGSGVRGSGLFPSPPTPLPRSGGEGSVVRIGPLDGPR